MIKLVSTDILSVFLLNFIKINYYAVTICDRTVLRILIGKNSLDNK